MRTLDIYSSTYADAPLVALLQLVDSGKERDVALALTEWTASYAMSLARSRGGSGGGGGCAKAAVASTAGRGAAAATPTLVSAAFKGASAGPSQRGGFAEKMQELMQDLGLDAQDVWSVSVIYMYIIYIYIYIYILCILYCCNIYNI